MERLKSFGGLAGLEAPSAQRFACWILILVSFLVTALIVPMLSVAEGIAIVAAWAALIWFALIIIYDKIDVIALIWVSVYPYCYYFLSFPKEHALFTVDRAFVGLVIIYMCSKWKQVPNLGIPRDILLSGFFWAMFLLICAASIIIRPPAETLFTYRQFIDGLVLPAFLGLYAICDFPTIKHLGKLHGATCILVIGISVIALIELFTGQDLLPWIGSEAYIVGSLVQIRRVDGPFENSAVLALVSIFGLFFIAFLRHYLPSRISVKRRILHVFGMLAAMLATLAPMDRSLIIAVMPVAIIDLLLPRRLLAKRVWVSLFVIIFISGISLKLIAPEAFADRTTDPQNLFQRIAQAKETLHVIHDYPVFGVGFGAYHETVSRSADYLARWKGIESMMLQHNLLARVLSEEGLVGFIFYVLALFFLIRTSWNMKRTCPLGWKTVSYCFIVYLIVGIDVDILSPSDLNLFLLFMLGIILKLQMQSTNINQQGLLREQSV